MSVMETPVHLSLQAYLAQIQQVIKQQFSAQQWVVAELSEFNKRPNGHCYLSLIESADGKEFAKCNATMFSSVANLQLKAFRSITGCDPAPGMKVLLNVSASLHPQYGFQLQVHGLDGNYTLGEMHARVEQIVQRLKTEGYYGRQKQLSNPTGYWRVAVVSPAQAAGLGDFRRDADRLHHHGLVEFAYYNAVFQGSTAASSIKEALKRLYADHANAAFDAVCLIRGGGAKADLAWLNDYSLAVWICRIPIPVYTGIGHERDETVLDLVAHTRFDTPSKVVGAVMRHLHHEANQLQSVIDRGQSIAARLVADEDARLQQITLAYRHLVRQRFKDAVNDFKNDKQRFETGISWLLNEQTLFLQSTRSDTQLMVRALLGQAQEKLTGWEQQYRSLIERAERDATDNLMHCWHEAISQMRMLVQGQIASHTQNYHAYHRLVPAMLATQDSFLGQAGLQASALSERLIGASQSELKADVTKANNLLMSRVQTEEAELNALRQRYANAVLVLVRDEEHRLGNLQSLFTALDPRAVMAKGFVLIKAPDGRVISSANAVSGGDDLVVQFHDGEIKATARN